MKVPTLGSQHLLLLMLVFSWGCAPESRQQALALVFDGVERPPPPSALGRPGAPPAPAEIQPDTNALPAAPAEDPGNELDTYAALAAFMPRDGRGNLDWVQATKQGLIAPRPNIDPKVPAFPELPMDIELDPGIPNFKVVFPHEPHTYWLHCSSCHPKIFEMKAGANDISMAKIFRGEFCGRCHGKVAFAPAQGCPRCHVQSGL